MPRIKDAHGITARRRAYDVLRRALVLGRLPQGQRLREAEWSHRLGVNRCALREALGRLHSEGLVAEGEKTGYRVPEYTEQDVEEMAEIRCTMEGLAAEQIIRKGRNHCEHLRRLHELCDELEWLLERNYGIELLEADQLFHEALVELSGNRRLVLLHRCLPLNLSYDANDRAMDFAVRARSLLRDHQQIVEAIQKGQPRLARTLLHRHYENDVLDADADPAAVANLPCERGKSTPTIRFAARTVVASQG